MLEHRKECWYTKYFCFLPKRLFAESIWPLQEPHQPAHFILRHRLENPERILADLRPWAEGLSLYVCMKGNIKMLLIASLQKLSLFSMLQIGFANPPLYPYSSKLMPTFCRYELWPQIQYSNLNNDVILKVNYVNKV